MIKKPGLPTLLITCYFFTACSSSQKLSKVFLREIEKNPVFMQAHVGVSVVDAATRQPILQYNSKKYFVPASNVKIPTLYAGLKYFGNKLPGLNYIETSDTLYIEPTGDPTFLHPDYPNHPVFEFLKKVNKPIVINSGNWKTEALGYGWSWDDYLGSYSAERSPMPIYGNCIKWIQQRTVTQTNGVMDTTTDVITEPETNWDVHFSTKDTNAFSVTRPRTLNSYTINEGKELKRELEIPFATDTVTATLELLKDTLHKFIFRCSEIGVKTYQTLFSQNTDSMLNAMMSRSDNFFAEQTLLMVSNHLAGNMNEQQLIDSLLRSDLKDFPQKPVWVDGSGLSRYNLFTPDDFTWLLLKMKDEFGMDRLKQLFATGNSGTLRNYYKEESGFIFAKTGTLSGHVALSGYLYTSKNKLLVFSFLVNNHHASSTQIRRAVETFIQSLRKKY